MHLVVIEIMGCRRGEKEKWESAVSPVKQPAPLTGRWLLLSSQESSFVTTCNVPAAVCRG